MHSVDHNLIKTGRTHGKSYQLTNSHAWLLAHNDSPTILPRDHCTVVYLLWADIRHRIWARCLSCCIKQPGTTSVE